MPDHSNLLHNLVLALESIYSPFIYLPNEVPVPTPAVGCCGGSMIRTNAEVLTHVGVDGNVGNSSS